MHPLPNRQISPLFTTTPKTPTSTPTTTTPSPSSSTNKRISLLSLLSSTQNVTVKIHATSHLFTTTVPLASAPHLLPAYFSAVIAALDTLPPKTRDIRDHDRDNKSKNKNESELGIGIGNPNRNRNRREVEVERGGRKRDMRIKVVISHGLRRSGVLRDLGAEGDEWGDAGVEEIEYLFFGTKKAVVEWFPVYLGAVLAVEGDPGAVERVNEVFLGDAD